MGREWQIGDPVDYTTDGWMDAQNWGHGRDDEPRNYADEVYVAQSDKYSNKAWNYFLDGDYSTALFYINKSLDLNSGISNSWNRKAIILEYQEKYSLSEECYERSLEIAKNDVVYDNLARMLLGWTYKLIENGKNSRDESYFDLAEEKIRKAIDIVSRPQSSENPEKYQNKLDSLNYYRQHVRKYLKNIETLKSYDKDELFTIAGMRYYDIIPLTQGLPLRLVKEQDNEYDRDAIAIYADDKKIGYVANQEYTSYEKTSKASELKSKIPDEAHGEYLMFLDKDLFYIGRIL